MSIVGIVIFGAILIGLNGMHCTMCQFRQKKENETEHHCSRHIVLSLKGLRILLELTEQWHTPNLNFDFKKGKLSYGISGFSKVNCNVRVWMRMSLPRMENYVCSITKNQISK
jgi:hypothetical protein